MKVKLSLIVAVAFVFSLALFTYAQDPQPQGPPPQPQGPSSLDVQGIKSYLLGPGDVLDVRVFGQPELSSSVQVDSDGNLSSLPFLEKPIVATCRTDKDGPKDLAAA
jgi:protein involved in polysaccharide export with SLBB domain